MRVPANGIAGRLGQALALALLVLGALVAIALGAVLLAFAVGIAALAGIAIAARLWWLRRNAPSPRPRATGRTIEGEYRRRR